MLRHRLVSKFKEHKKIFTVLFVIIAVGAAWLEFVKGDLLYPLHSEDYPLCNMPKRSDGYYMYYNFDEIIVHLASYPSKVIVGSPDYPDLLQKNNLKKLIVSQLEKSFSNCLKSRAGGKKPISIFDRTWEPGPDTLATSEFKWINNNKKLVLRIDVRFSTLPNMGNLTGVGYISYRLYRPDLPLSYPYYYIERSMPYFSRDTSKIDIINFVEGIKLEKVWDPGRCYYCTVSGY